MAAKKSVGVQLVNGKPVKTAGGGSTVVLDEDANKTRLAAAALLTRLQPQLPKLAVIETDEDYARADKIFGEVQATRKAWKLRMEDIIRPISDGLQKLYKLNRDVDKPLGELENAIERPMKAFKLAEARRVQEEAEAVLAEQQRLQTQQAKAKNPIIQQRIAEQLETVEAWQPETVQGVHSTTKLRRKVRITNLQAFALAVGEGLIPVDALEVKQSWLNAQHKDDAETVEGWPGVEGYDDVDISGR